MSTPIVINHWIANQEVPAEAYRDVTDPGMFDTVVARASRCGL